MDDIQEKAEKLIAKMKADRGYIYPEWEFAAKLDPDFVEAYNNIYRIALNDGQALSAKVRELIAIGILSFKGDANSVKAHIQRAVKLGATKQEIFEAVETSIIPGGAPTFYCGLSAILKFLNEAKKE